MPIDPTQLRIGHGHDTHRLGPGRKLMLGGLEIPHTTGGIGHSDADVLLHALIDALLGAAGLGDIGEHFPDTAAEFAGIDSAILLERAWQEVRAAGWEIVNLDATIHAQRPKLRDHKPAIRQHLAGLLGISADVVNVKAKTGEAVGPVGREEAVMADVVVLLARRSSP